MRKQEQGLDNLPRFPTQIVNGHLPAAIAGILLHHVHSLFLVAAPWFQEIVPSSFLNYVVPMVLTSLTAPGEGPGALYYFSFTIMVAIKFPNWLGQFVLAFPVTCNWKILKTDAHLIWGISCTM